MTIVLSEAPMSYLMDQLLADQMRIRQRTETPATPGTWPDSQQPMAAEACTDEGISPQAGARIGVLIYATSAAAVIGFIGLIVAAVRG